MIKKLILLILLFQFQTSFSQKRKSVILDTLKFKSKKCETCPVENIILIYKLLKCGLYEGNNKDIAFKSARLKSDFESEKSFISSIWGVNKKDSINGGIVEMKNVIDTKSFKFLNYSYWKEKKKFITISQIQTAEVSQLLILQIVKLYKYLMILVTLKITLTFTILELK